MRDPVDRWITSPDQLGSAKLRESLPIFFENVKRIAVLEIFKCYQAVSEPRSKVTSEPTRADDEAVVIEPIEQAEPFGGHLQSFGISLFPARETVQDPLCRTRG